jgi:septal ring factor EnvC (AmiA/AmiB activator)
MLLLALLDPSPSDAMHPVEDATSRLVQSGILGSLLVLVGAFAFYAVWKWNKANEARVEDNKKSAAEVTALNNDLKDTLREVLSTIDALKSSMQSSTEALKASIQANTEAVKANTAASATMERTINETVRDAVRASGYRRSSTPTGTPIVPPKTG